METSLAMDVTEDAILTLLLTATPIMAVGLAVGLAIALFQALTQIQEMTLTFVPKILSIFAALLVFLPHMNRTMSDFMIRIADRVASLQ